MKFGPRPLGDCCGHILAHSIKTGRRRLAKGTRLTDADIAGLSQDGIEELVIAEAEAGDIHEDDAVDRLARVLAPHGVSLSVAATGRVNIKVEKTSLVHLFTERLLAFNLIDEGLTCSTVQHHQLLSSGQMVATLKIIPFFLSVRAVEAAEAILAEGALFACYPLQGCNAGLIQTVSPALKTSVRKTTHQVTDERLSALGCSLVSSIECEHDSVALSEEIKKMKVDGISLILICGASAMSDRRDVVPQATTKAGGHIEQLGLAVDPGNLTMVARIDDTMIIGMPGCARSSRLNGLDWVLHLYLAGLPIDRNALASMAAGGLLMEIASRPLPRELAPETEYVRRKSKKYAAKASHLVGIVLAAGQSRRMGNENKLLMTFDGQPLVRNVANTLMTAGCTEIIVVTGHEDEAVKAALSELELTFVFAKDYEKGQGHSLATGVSALPKGVTDTLVMLGDMPLVSAELVSGLIAHHSVQPDHEGIISLPVFGGKRGHPVIWGKQFFDELSVLKGDIGGRQLLEDYANAIRPFYWDRPEMFLDADTKEAFDKMEIETKAQNILES